MPKWWTTGLLIVFLAALAALSGYNYLKQPFLTTEQELPSPEPTASVSVELLELPSAEILIQELTLRQKIAQVLVLPITIDTFTEVQTETPVVATIIEGFENNMVASPVEIATSSAKLSYIPQFLPGGYLVFGEKLSDSEFANLLKQTNELEIASSTAEPLLKPLIIVDHEGGTVQRLSGQGFTHLPSWQELCKADPTERQALLASSATELRAANIDMVLAPMLDRATAQSPLGSRICSSDPTIIAAAATDYVSAFLQSSIVPVFKHFPGIGGARYDLHKRFDIVTVQSEDVALYKLLIERFPFVPVMVSHIGVKNQFASLPCSLSVDCVQELLAVFPDTVVVSDALDMASARSTNGNIALRRPLSDVAVDALAAGNTIILLGERVTETEQKSVVEAIELEYKTNATFASRLDTAVQKVVELKLRIARDRQVKLTQQ